MTGQPTDPAAEEYAERMGELRALDRIDPGSGLLESRRAGDEYERWLGL